MSITCNALRATLLLSFFASVASAAYSMEPGVTPSQYFTPIPTSLMSDDTATAIKYSIGNETGYFNLAWWAQRGMLIREGGNDLYCLGNLSYALLTIGSLNAGEYSGAAGTLALLPTAGALIGAPTKELWLLFKLMPILGVLTMFLSIGGTIMPSDAGAYNLDNLNYGGMVATERQKNRAREKAQTERTLEHLPPHRRFARQVAYRAGDLAGGNGWAMVWIGVLLQLIFLGAILTVLWFGQRGSVIPWWCRVWGWMYFWLFLVVTSSMFENFTSTPFNKTWTMRISRAPKNIELSQDAPRIGPHPDALDQAEQELLAEDDRLRTSRLSEGYYPHTTQATGNVLHKLKNGVDSQSRIVIFEGDPSERPRSCFFVIVSLEGATTPAHAILKLLSKGSTLAVYAFGTALFAGAQLMSISVALMILSVVLACAAFARVNGLFVAAEMNKSNDPILHAIVQSDEEANAYVGSILAERGLVVEMMGHIIVEGRVVARFSQWLSLANYIGLLAPPFDLRKIAVPSQSVLSRRQTWESLRSVSGVVTPPSKRNIPIETVELMERVDL